MRLTPGVRVLEQMYMFVSQVKMLLHQVVTMQRSFFIALFCCGAKGSTTLGIITLSIMTLGIIITLSIKTISIMHLSKIGLQHSS